MSRRINVRFARELRAGASFHVESAALSVEDGLRLGHRFVDSANGAVVTWFEEHWELPARRLTSQQRTAIAGRLGAGMDRLRNGGRSRSPQTVSSPLPAAGSSPETSMRPAISPWARWCFAFPMPPASLAPRSAWMPLFMQQQRRGFSTFELVLHMTGVLPLAAPYLVETGIGHLGGSSLRMIHRMTDPRTGADSRAAQPVWRQSRSRRTPTCSLAR